jgi:hypothetical protein
MSVMSVVVAGVHIEYLHDLHSNLWSPQRGELTHQLFICEGIWALNLARPEIFNTDQGVQLTSKDYTNHLLESQIRISWDGRGEHWTTFL